VGLDEVVGGPSQVGKREVELARGDVALAIFDDSPCQHRCRAGHRESELDVIPRVVPATREVVTDVSAIAKPGVAAPVDALVRRQNPGPLRLVEELRLLQRLGVIERLGARQAARTQQ